MIPYEQFLSSINSIDTKGKDVKYFTVLMEAYLY